MYIDFITRIFRYLPFWENSVCCRFFDIIFRLCIPLWPHICKYQNLISNNLIAATSSIAAPVSFTSSEKVSLDSTIIACLLCAIKLPLISCLNLFVSLNVHCQTNLGDWRRSRKGRLILVSRGRTDSVISRATKDWNRLPNGFPFPDLDSCNCSYCLTLGVYDWSTH